MLAPTKGRLRREVVGDLGRLEQVLEVGLHRLARTLLVGLIVQRRVGAGLGGGADGFEQEVAELGGMDRLRRHLPRLQRQRGLDEGGIEGAVRPDDADVPAGTLAAVLSVLGGDRLKRLLGLQVGLGLGDDRLRLGVSVRLLGRGRRRVGGQDDDVVDVRALDRRLPLLRQFLRLQADAQVFRRSSIVVLLDSGTFSRVGAPACV